MKRGDILFFHGTAVISRIIEWWTWSKWSHVAIYTGENSYIEATWPKCKETPLTLDELKQIQVMTWRSPLTEAEANALISDARQQIGTPYSLLGLLSFVIRKSIGNKHWYWCSSFVQEMATSIGRPLIRQVSRKTRPQDLFQSLEIQP